MRYFYLAFCVSWCYVAGGCSSNHPTYQFSLRGDLDDIKTGIATIRVFGDNLNHSIDSAVIVDGKFVLTCRTNAPNRFSVTAGEKSMYCFLDGKDMLVKGSLNSYCLTGSPANDLEKEYTRLVKEKVNKKRDSLMKEYRFMRDTRRGDQKSEDDLMTRILLLDDVHYKITYDFVSKHSDNMFSAYAACAVLYGRYEQAKAIYDLLGTDAQTSVFGLDLKNRVDDLARAAIGNICPDFTVVDTVGNETAMKSLLKTIFADKLVVIDFWASWCGPCRQEMKNLRGLYEEFSDQGVRFMSVSVDDNEAKWRKAYEEEKIPWINTWDKGGWANASVRKAFGFRQIPYIILLDREGKVVAQNVRRNTLREKIIEQLKR